MTLTDLLITPIQRIPRYSLLLKELNKKTPSTHPDHQDLCKAIQLFDELGQHINEQKKQSDSKTNRTIELQLKVMNSPIVRI